ncbi:MAG TPA: 4-alpha-glucanotransferase [Sphaerochaeta sp.]|nr:4-alpha-glucanotransferase [Sphaerochaeta sp.]
MRTKSPRHSGVLLHISSLPNPFGIGDLGAEAYAFADKLASSGFDHWQILPLGPTGYGNSPYASRSTFAGNELFIDVRSLVQSELLAETDIACPPPFPVDRVDYEAVLAWKLPLVKQAALRFLERLDQTDKNYGFRLFCDSERYWLDDYALFMTLYEHYHDARWFSHWQPDHGRRMQTAITTYLAVHAQEIEIWKAMQFFFHQQWLDFRRHVNHLGIKLIGDLPIFVAADSVDTWSNPELFKTDATGNFTALSGVPPDFFSATGQLWGNPVYDWNACARTGYRWWIQRISRALQYTDILRIDHFRGFDAYWEVPAGQTTAEHGTWVQAPGQDFFATLRRVLGEVPIIAEDLGVMTPSVEQLRDTNGFPGMKICQFGFSLDPQGDLDSHDEFLPHNYGYGCVAYTGTHDNDTTLGWFKSIDARLQAETCRYLHCPREEIVMSMIRAVVASHAQYVVIPLQDIFNLDSKARMNTPSTCGPENWAWRLTDKQFRLFPSEELHVLLKTYGRIPPVVLPVHV